MIKATSLPGWNQYETDDDYEVIVNIGDTSETWKRPVILYPDQPQAVYAVPVVDFDGRGPIAWPLRGEPDTVDRIVQILGEMDGDYDTWREIIEEPYGRGE